MPDNLTKLPEFKNPPVTEVALSVQFEPRELSPENFVSLALRLHELGYVRIEQHPPLQPAIERFGPPRGPSRVVVELGSPATRHWFISQDDTRLVQVQPDRLVLNWRKTGEGDKYPRFEQINREFAENLSRFSAFVTDKELGELVPNQVEVTYVNHVRLADEMTSGLHLADVVGIAGSNYADGFLPLAEDERAVARYVFERDGKPAGRLHINAHTAIDLEHGQPIVVINLTARGSPISEDIAGVLGFMEMGREWIVRGFADVTTRDMHKMWERVT